MSSLPSLLSRKQRLVNSIPPNPKPALPTICRLPALAALFLSNLLDEIDAVVQRNAWWSFNNRKEVALILFGIQIPRELFGKFSLLLPIPR